MGNAWASLSSEIPERLVQNFRIPQSRPAGISEFRNADCGIPKRPPKVPPSGRKQAKTRAQRPAPGSQDVRSKSGPPPILDFEIPLAPVSEFRNPAWQAEPSTGRIRGRRNTHEIKGAMHAGRCKEDSGISQCRDAADPEFRNRPPRRSARGEISNGIPEFRALAKSHFGISKSKNSNANVHCTLDFAGISFSGCDFTFAFRASRNTAITRSFVS